MRRCGSTSRAGRTSWNGAASRANRRVSAPSAPVEVADATPEGRTPAVRTPAREARPAPARVPVAEPRPAFHLVKRGETLFAIAERYGVEVKDLKKWNKVKRAGIQVGQRLRLKR